MGTMDNKHYGEWQYSPQEDIAICSECGYEHYTEFGLVKRYINENGPGTAIEIEAATGVHRKKIQEFLREGRLEAVNSPFDSKN